MVVQHNLMSMNAYRMLGMTSKAQSKSSEKLSSGYKINRAADDAAGLAISEKMRKQIKGLDRSSTNAQDGVSAVQTAEGALSEVHSMLQRMNELAVQAANGTNSEDDRNAIQSEIELLSQEIDRVSETTKFNETFLLKGSESTKRYYLVGHDAGLKGRLSDGAKTAEFEIGTYWPGDEVRIGNRDYTIGSSKEDAAELINKITDNMESHANRAVNANTQKVAYESKEAEYATRASNAQSRADSQLSGSKLEAQYTKEADELGACRDAYGALADAYGDLENECARSINTKSIRIGDITYTATYEPMFNPAVAWTDSRTGAIYDQNQFLNTVLPVPSSVEVEYITGSDRTDANATIQDAQADANALGAKAQTAGFHSRDDVNTGYGQANTFPHTYYHSGSPYSFDYSTEFAEIGSEYALIESNYAELVAEKQVIIGKGTWDASYNYNDTPVVTWTEYFSSRTTNDTSSLVDITTPVPTNRVQGYRVLYEANLLDIMKDEDFNGDGNGVDDNEPTLITREKAYQYTKRELLAANNIGATGQLAQIEYDVMEKDRKVIFSIEKGFAEVNASLNFAIHAGADADLTNKISINIEAMSTAGLGIDKMNIADSSGLAATYAIDAITDAINKVSTQRSSLGAIQNRLEHTIDNLDNVVENTTDSESRIRDTDMAEEMVEYSKNNILAQAGQAMLAQANQTTQGVLSLLQ